MKSYYSKHIPAEVFLKHRDYFENSLLALLERQKKQIDEKLLAEEVYLHQIKALLYPRWVIYPDLTCLNVFAFLLHSCFLPCVLQFSKFFYLLLRWLISVVQRHCQV